MKTDAIGSLRGLERLDQAYKRARTEAERRLITIKRACFLARLSRVPEAQADLRRARLDSPLFDPLASGWALFCEGLIEHFDSLGPGALGRFRRAHAVAVSIGDSELAATTSAWIAAAEFAASNVDGFAAPLRRAFQFAAADAHAALTRSCILVGDALSWSGRHSIAKPWYTRAWRHAVEDADFPMQIVALHNEAAYRISDAVLLDCQKLPTSNLVHAAAACLNSAGSLDVGIGRNRLTSIIPLLSAELFTVQGKWDEAIALFDVFLVDDSVKPAARQLPKCLAERAFCKANLADIAGALADVALAIEGGSACSDMDDLYVLHTRSSMVFDLARRSGDAEAHREIAARCLSSYRESQACISAQLDPVIEEVESRSPAWL